jgi:hypothetical protein
MNNFSAADIDQLTVLLNFLLFSVGISALILGTFLGWYIRGRYESWLWLKTGIYCDDCAPLVDRSKEQGGNQ